MLVPPAVREVDAGLLGPGSTPGSAAGWGRGGLPPSRQWRRSRDRVVSAGPRAAPTDRTAAIRERIAGSRRRAGHRPEDVTVSGPEPRFTFYNYARNTLRGAVPEPPRHRGGGWWNPHRRENEHESGSANPRPEPLHRAPRRRPRNRAGPFGLRTMSENETGRHDPRRRRRGRRRQQVRQGERQNRGDRARRGHRGLRRPQHRAVPRRDLPPTRRRGRRARARDRRHRRVHHLGEPLERRRSGPWIGHRHPPGLRQRGRTCREFQQTVIIGGREEQSYGTACRDGNGDWKIVSS